MAKQFITERDIEDMARRGEFSIIMTDSTVLTELAFEKADRLGVKLIQPHQLPPTAPIRPYLSEIKPAKQECGNCIEPSGFNEDNVKQRIRDAVKAKLGNQVDSNLLETIINRVLNNVGVK